MKIRHTIWGGLLLALAACGGGGGGGGGGTTLAPAEAPPSFDNDTGTQSFSSNSVVGVYANDLNSGSTSNVARSNNTRVIVDFDTGTIRIIVNQATDSNAVVTFDQTFGPGDLTQTVTGAALYETANGFLVIHDPSTSPFNLKYTSFGVWGTQQFGPTFGTAAAGFITTTINLPTTGTAQYTGLTFGIGIEDGVGYGIAGNVTIDANFGDGTVTGLFHGMVRVDASSNASAFENISFSATVDATTVTYSGTTSSTRPGFSSGDVEGSFFGPNAEETGGTWRLKADTGDDVYVGAYGATQ